MQQITSVYQAAQKKGLQLSRKESYIIGIRAKRIFMQLTGEQPTKIQQQENGQQLLVNAYPQEMEIIINNLIQELYATQNQPS